mmetsp:Transcript_863/g.1944  ORF Transcript_863/g.1944 Transcript_863/m.1944 type:complete len:288 (+) Transcript_863:79-942(+)
MMAKSLVSRAAQRAVAGRSLAALARHRPAAPSSLLAPASSRGIVDAETMGTVMRVDKEHWSSFMFGRERQLLIHVINESKEGDCDGVLEAMDSFWSETFQLQGTESWRVRGDLIDKVLRERSPLRAVEIGTYCGYSALRIAKALPEDGRLVSIEVDPLFAAIATKIVEHAGLAHKVRILMGTVEQRSNRILEVLKATPSPGSVVDFLLCDHSKEMFVPDLRLLEEKGILGQGTIVMGDTTVYPGDEEVAGAQDLLSYFSTHPKYKVQEHMGTSPSGGITVSEWVHLP